MKAKQKKMTKAKSDRPSEVQLEPSDPKKSLDELIAEPLAIIGKLDKVAGEDSNDEPPDSRWPGKSKPSYMDPIGKVKAPRAWGQYADAVVKRAEKKHRYRRKAYEPPPRKSVVKEVKQESPQINKPKQANKLVQDHKINIMPVI